MSPQPSLRNYGQLRAVEGEVSFFFTGTDTDTLPLFQYISVTHAQVATVIPQYHTLMKNHDG